MAKKGSSEPLRNCVRLLGISDDFNVMIRRHCEGCKTGNDLCILEVADDVLLQIRDAPEASDSDTSENETRKPMIRGRG
jgi:hypothetical protein